MFMGHRCLHPTRVTPVSVYWFCLVSLLKFYTHFPLLSIFCPIHIIRLYFIALIFNCLIRRSRPLDYRVCLTYFFSPSVYFQPLKCKAKKGTDDKTVNWWMLRWIYHADQMGREQVNVTFWEETWKSAACRPSKKWVGNIKMHPWSRLLMWKQGWSDSESCSVVSLGVRGRAVEVIFSRIGGAAQNEHVVLCQPAGPAPHLRGNVKELRSIVWVGETRFSVTFSNTFPLLGCLQLKPDLLLEPVGL